MMEFDLVLPEGTLNSLNPNNPALYSYEIDTLSLAPMQEFAVTNQIFNKLNRHRANGSIVERFTQSGETEYIANLTEEIKQNLKSGQWVFATKKKSGKYFGTLRDKTGQFASQVELTPREVKELGELATLSAMQSQLHEISKQLENLTHQVMRVEQGQYNDRYAGFFTARQLLVEAYFSNNEQLKQELLLSAIKTANDTQSKVKLALHSDAKQLISPKINNKEIKLLTSRIQQSIAYLNASVQLNIIAYTTLGEQGAIIACLNNYQAFIKQVFLTKQEGRLRHLAGQMDNFSSSNRSLWTNSLGQLTTTITGVIDQTNNFYLEEKANDTEKD